MGKPKVSRRELLISLLLLSFSSGDSKIAFTMLSPVAVTALSVYNQNVKLQSVTGGRYMIKNKLVGEIRT